MKKKTIANLIMVFIIAIIVIAGVLGVGWIRGWFDKGENAAQVSSVRGIVNIQREGVAYPVEANTVLRDGDQLTCTPGATAVLSLDGENYAVIGENADVSVLDAQLLSLEVFGGEVFVVSGSSPLGLSFDGKDINIENSVVSLSVRTGAQTLSVYKGTVQDASEGYALNWIGEDISVVKMVISALNAFTINQLRNVNQRVVTCFPTDELDKLEEERFAEMQARINPPAQAAEETSAVEEASAAEESYSAESKDGNAAPSGNQETKPSSTASSNNGAQTNSPAGEETVPSGTSAVNPAETSAAGTSSKPAAEPTTSQTEAAETTPPATEPELTCYIAIYCDTILDNWDNLEDGKGAYVPANGVILYSTPVTFTEGETVFDVLKRICDSCGIQMEYSWTPMYSSYYIEGINHLYEFDCGPESGWMYKVNGWFPNYGCSAYTLTGGEDIVWCYTCNGLGADVGSTWME